VARSRPDPGDPLVAAGLDDSAGLDGWVDEPDPQAATEELAASRDPYLIGVRHHSAVLAHAVPALLERFAPQRVLVELPMEFAEWLPWLAHPEAVAPLALGGASTGDDGPLAFFPFADFSPELAALRWAVAHGVPVAPCDLPLADPRWQRERDGGDSPILDALRRHLTGRDGDDVWDRLVEVGSVGATPEQVRRAALAVGWAMRTGSTVSTVDLAREAWMRDQITQAQQTHPRVAVVVGAYHAPALLKPYGPRRQRERAGARAGRSEIVTSLVPYPFELLDERSGYPAGIRDPQWHQEIFDAGAAPAAVAELVASVAVRVAAALRRAKHPAGPAEAREIARLATDLARLRGLPAPGRGELVEAVQTVLAQGEIFGRGRAVAAAMEEVLVGSRRGALAPGTPASGLVAAVTKLIAELRLPGPGAPGQVLRLDPLRSPLDRRREVTLHRLDAARILYAQQQESVAAGGTDTLTTVWFAKWTPTTDGTLAAAGMRGVTLRQAAMGRLAWQRRRQTQAGGPTPQQAVDGLSAAVHCGLSTLVSQRLDDVRRVVVTTGTLTDIIAALSLLDRVALGHVPGTPTAPPGLAEVVDLLDGAAVREIVGLTGSDDLDDARALLAVAHRADQGGRSLRLHAALRELARSGTPTMQGAAGAVGVLVGLEPAQAFGERLASWVDSAGDELRPRLAGALVAAGALLAAGGPALAPLAKRIEEYSDAAFTQRLPGLRAGFDALSPAARERMRADLEARLGNLDTPYPAETLARWLDYDRAGAGAVAGLGLADARILPVHRWRLLLGRRAEGLPAGARRQANALDELYGAGRGEGSRDIDDPRSGGRGTKAPTIREWRDELTELFGAEVCEQVLGEAARRGNREAALELDAMAVRPSVELLHSVLSLAGGLPEAEQARLRPLVARLVTELTARLANRLRPALTGLTTARPTRRRTGTIDLAATIRANLRTARVEPDGRVLVLPERLRYRERARRSADWRLILVTDVSGSMESSTVWAALTSAVLSGLPALSTHFLAFSDEVIDLTEHAHDPLSLLIEVRVGGGTHIANALRHARGLVTVPHRTMVVVVSDFEEGQPLRGLLDEVRALASSGCRLLGCAALDDQARPRYAVGVAAQLAEAGMPVAALSPLALARWVADQVR
jgi:Mg-chelatase subunit ChlD